MHQLIIFLIVGNLLLYLLLFFFRKRVQIQFIAEAARHGDHASGGKGRNSACLVVRACGYMGAHCADRIQEGGAILDIQPLYGIRIIAAPDLGRIIQHGCVKPSSSAAAAFNHQIRERCRQPFQQFIYAQHAAVINLTLFFLRQRSAVNVTHAAVHIPFHIIDVRMGKDVRHSFKQIIPDLLS